MLPFKPIEITDKPEADKLLKKIDSMLCAHCFVDLFIWKSVYDTQVCFKDGFFFVKQVQDGNTVYTVPIGDGCLCEAIDLVKQDAKERNVKFNLSAVNENQKKILEEICPERFEFVERRDSEDYIYTGESLISLAGKKLHSKRNFINRFTNEYENRWSYEEITEKNIHDAFEYHLSWCAQNTQNTQNNDDDYFGETCAISIALKNREALA